MRTARFAIGMHFLVGASFLWHDAAAQVQGNGDTGFREPPGLKEVFVETVVLDVNLKDDRFSGVAWMPIPGTDVFFGVIDDYVTGDEPKADANWEPSRPHIVTRSGEEVTIEIAAGTPQKDDGVPDSLTLQVIPEVQWDDTIELDVQIVEDEEPGAPEGGLQRSTLGTVNFTLNLTYDETAAIGGVLPNVPSEPDLVTKTYPVADLVIPIVMITPMTSGQTTGQ